MLVEESPKGMKKETVKEDFEKVFLVALEEGLSTLGRGKDVIFLFLESTCSLRKEEIPSNAKLFELMLSEMLGPCNAHFIEELIIYKLFDLLPRELCPKFRNSVPFQKMLENIKRRFKDAKL